MDILFIFLLVVLCVLIAFYVSARNLKAGGAVSHRVLGGGKEIEARWLDVDIDDMRKKIEELGGELVHDEKQYRRYTFNLAEDTKDVKIEDSTLKVDAVAIKTTNSEKECKEFVKAIRSNGNGFARTREEYDGDNIVVTMTCKIYGEGNHADEYEVTTENTLDECREFLLAVGLQQKAYHETRRIKYKSKEDELKGDELKDINELKGINELTIDTVPGMPPYVEVEAEDEKTMFSVAKKLGLKKGDEHYGPYGKTFAEVYGFDQKWFDNDFDRLDFETFADRLREHVTKNMEMFDKAVSMFSKAEKLEEVGDDTESEEKGETDEVETDTSGLDKESESEEED